MTSRHGASASFKVTTTGSEHSGEIFFSSRRARRGGAPAMAPRFVFPVPIIRGWTSGSDPKRGGGGGGASFNGKKASLRPKFVATYEYLLRGTETEGSPAPRRAEPRFWDDLFLLDVNHQFLADALRKLSERELLERAPAVTEICARCSALTTGCVPTSPSRSTTLQRSPTWPERSSNGGPTHGPSPGPRFCRPMTPSSTGEAVCGHPFF